MKKGIFSSWFREIATIIFTQTIQAFLLAVVMSIIISALGKNTGQTDQDGQTAAAGLLAIIALSQFGKIEMLVKNIFGVTSGVADVSMQGGKGTLTAGKMLAMKGAGRLMDNTKKITTGLKSIKTRGEIKDLEAERDKLKNDDSINAALDPSKGSGKDFKKFSGDDGENDNLNVSSSAILEAIGQQTDAIKQQTAEIQRNRQEDKIKDLTQKIEAANKEKKAQVRTGISGVAETLGAGYGAAAGLSAGLATGDKIVESTLAGAGAGDVAGQHLANAAFSAKDTAKYGIGAIKNAPGKVMKNSANLQENKNKSNEAIAAIEKELAKAEEANDKEMQNKLRSQARDIQKTYNQFYKSSGLATKAATKVRDFSSGSSTKKFNKNDMKKFDAKHDIGKE